MKNIYKDCYNEIKNKTILITGGTGSFGKSILYTLLKNFIPKKIIIFSRDEHKQWELSRNINSNIKLFKKNIGKVRFFLGDVRDLDRLNLACNQVDILIHAAALKHVPSAEYNPGEYIKTNVNGANNIISASLSNKVKKIIALSTDKAANPINLYGATKLVSDKLFVAANNIVGKNKTIFSIVRYGNVVGSRGSIIPIFKNLSKNYNNKIPITDIEMTRFFITLQQGVNFVLKSLTRMQGGEIFVPKIPSVKIIDLIRFIAPKNKVKVIGIRPGEKLHEVLCPKDDSYHTIEFKYHYVIFPTLNLNDLNKNFFINKIKEKGKFVKKNFEYNSLNNSNYINNVELKKIINATDYTL